MKRSKTRNLSLLIIVVVCMAAVILFGLFYQQSDRTQQSVVKVFPAFSASSLNEPDLALSTQIFQQPYQLVNVWASWCGVCKREHDYLMQLSQSGVPIIGLNYRDKRMAASSYLSAQGNPYQQVIYDPKGLVALDLGVVGTPETYLVDQQGKIVLKFSGLLKPSVWQSSFAAYFSE
ncbi:DsbE family thiol:disulfide interchange protein [Vibrio sp. NTOU-M3]|uniref:DsbE family thiol:disulfide interchange protein n=1 Tax=Vibrio sp. NTOU-M3 TaxID=3234954 RepID=UPI00349F9949